MLDIRSKIEGLQWDPIQVQQNIGNKFVIIKMMTSLQLTEAALFAQKIQ